MKKLELKQIIREEIQKSLKEQTNTGLITFEQLKQACIENYNEYISDVTDGNQSLDDSELDEASNIDELVNILDGLGFNGDEAYNFIFDAILK